MTAYIVFSRERVHDKSELETYAKKVKGTMAGHAITRLAAYGRHEVLEGSAVEGLVILSFPTFEEAKAWYYSPAYQEASEHRFKGADYRAILIDGV